MSQQALLDDVSNAVQAFDWEKVMEATKKAISAGIDPSTIIEQGLAKGLKVVGKKFEDGELFLMHLVQPLNHLRRRSKKFLSLSSRSERARENRQEKLYWAPLPETYMTLERILLEPC